MFGSCGQRIHGGSAPSQNRSFDGACHRTPNLGFWNAFRPRPGVRPAVKPGVAISDGDCGNPRTQSRVGRARHSLWHGRSKRGRLLGRSKAAKLLHVAISTVTSAVCVSDSGRFVLSYLERRSFCTRTVHPWARTPPVPGRQRPERQHFDYTFS